ncbi:MAG TPA: hypothetical protein VM681_09720 [Candidatus Thermoplasmatota archaeon]|nr:hypothetical protein [Candidatus Thermoplasmatota archaeon]
MPKAKEIKVKIPIHQHLKLHTLKLTQGITITEAVETALKNYFDRNPEFHTFPGADLPELADVPSEES